MTDHTGSAADDLATASVPHLATELPGPKAREWIARDAAVASPSMARVYDLVPARGAGCTIEDVDGNRFLDFNAGIAVTATGGPSAATPSPSPPSTSSKAVSSSTPPRWATGSWSACVSCRASTPTRWSTCVGQGPMIGVELPDHDAAEALEQADLAGDLLAGALADS